MIWPRRPAPTACRSALVDALRISQGFGGLLAGDRCGPPLRSTPTTQTWRTRSRPGSWSPLPLRRTRPRSVRGRCTGGPSPSSSPSRPVPRPAPRSPAVRDSGQPQELVLTTSVSGQRQLAVARGDATAGRPRERVCLLDERRCRLRLARQEMDADARRERQDQLREQPRLTGGPDVVIGEAVPSLVVPDEPCCPTGQPSPAQGFGGFDVAAREGRDGDLRTGGVPASGPWARSVARPSRSRSAGAWIGCRGRGERRVRHLFRRRRCLPGAR